ncbi:MAG: hypothetical protein LBD58_13245 [Treponema sp.]|jgi:hypothetical protein|nr:hypothetical protein [Treponema sp.]
MEEKRVAEHDGEVAIENMAKAAPSFVKRDASCDEESGAERDEETTVETAETASVEYDAWRDEESGAERGEETTVETAETASVENDAWRDEESGAERDEETTVETAETASVENDAWRDEESGAERDEETTVETAETASVENDIRRNEKRKRRRDVLKREDELLQKIIETHNAVKNAVINREWTDFEALAFSLETYKEQFDVLEEERLALFETAPDVEGKAPHFYTMVSRLPEDERRELSDLYRSVKDRALKLQTANEALLRYLNEARSTIGDFMKAAFPDRKSGVYSRQGKRVLSDMRSLILDQIL